MSIQPSAAHTAHQLTPTTDPWGEPIDTWSTERICDAIGVAPTDDGLAPAEYLANQAIKAEMKYRMHHFLINQMADHALDVIDGHNCCKTFMHPKQQRIVAKRFRRFWTPERGKAFAMSGKAVSEVNFILFVLDNAQEADSATFRLGVASNTFRLEHSRYVRRLRSMRQCEPLFGYEQIIDGLGGTHEVRMYRALTDAPTMQGYADWLIATQ